MSLLLCGLAPPARGPDVGGVEKLEEPLEPLLLGCEPPADDTRLIIAAAREGISRLYRDGFSYAKAQVLLLDLCKRDEYTPDLFAPEKPVRTERLMSTLDAINERWGRGTLKPGRIAKQAEWGMRRELLSPA